MFCVKCGEKLLNDSKFCPICGEKVSLPVASLVNNQNPVVNQVNYQNTAENQVNYQNPVENQVDYRNPVVAQMDYQNPIVNQVDYQNPIANEIGFSTEGTKQKGKRKKKVLVGGISAIIALAIILTVCYVFFAPSIKAYVLGTKNYYLLVEGKNLTEGFQDIKNNLENYPKKYNYDCDLSTKLSGDIFGESQESEKIIDTLSKFRFNLKFDCNNENLKDSYSTFSFSGLMNGKEIGKVVLENADNKTKISYPKLTDKTMASEATEKSSKLKDAMLGDDVAFEEVFGLKRDAYNDMLQKYKDIIFDSIPKEQVQFNKNSTYKDLDCNSITITLNEKDISKISKALAKEIRQDQEFKILLKSSKTLYNYLPSSGELSHADETSTEEINDEIDEICESLEDGTEDMGKINVEYSIYFNNDETIIGRKFIDKETQGYVELASYTSADKKDIFIFSVEENENSMLFSKESKVDKKNNVGNIKLKINKETLLDAEYTSEINATVGGLNAFVGNIKGKLNFSSLNESQYGLDSSLSSLDFSYESKKSDEGDKLLGECKISTKVDGKSFVLSLITKTKQSNSNLIGKPNISISDSIDFKDAEALSELESEIQNSLSEKLMGVLSKAAKDTEL